MSLLVSTHSSSFCIVCAFHKKTTEGLLQVVFFFIFNSKKITKFTAKRDEFFSVEMHRVLIIS